MSYYYLKAIEQESDDAKLLERISCRDEESLTILIKRYGPRVLGLCKAILSDPLDAESVMSDVFLEIWNRPRRYDHKRGSFCGYLLTMARSRSIDHFRKHRARLSLLGKSSETNYDGIAHFDTAESSALRTEIREQVVNALERLPEIQRQSLVLAFFSGLTHLEVAEEMKLPLGTVKSHIRRGLLQLKSLLAAKEMGEVV